MLNFSVQTTARTDELASMVSSDASAKILTILKENVACRIKKQVNLDFGVL
jgi:hypothetical protein